MTSTNIVASFALGFLHGFIAWRLMFGLIGPVARICGLHASKLMVSEALTHIIAFLFLLIVSFLLLEDFGLLATTNPSMEYRGYLFIGSMCGLVMSGILPHLEAAIRSRAPKKVMRNLRLK